MENSEKNDMILYVNGDSNTYGEELVPDKYKELLVKPYKGEPGAILDPMETETERLIFNDYRLKHCWGAKLGELIGATTVINQAFPGASNDRITRTTFEYINSNYEDIKNNPNNYIFILGLSSANRNEFFYDNIGLYRNFCPTDTHEHVEYYFTRLCTTTNDLERSYKHIINLQNLFQKLNVKYKFFQAYVPKFSADLDINNPHMYANLIDTTHCIKETFHGYVGEHYPTGPRFHYFEGGHMAWAKYLRSQI